MKLDKLLSQAKVKEMKAKRFAADAKEMYDRYERMKEAKRVSSKPTTRMSPKSRN